MFLINEQIKTQLSTAFQGLDKKIKIVLFTEIMKCQYCRETQSLYEEIADLSGKIEFISVNMSESKDLVEKYRLLEMTPVTVMLGENEKDYGIRFYGIPAGYEFTSLIETLILLSKGNHMLNPETVQFLQELSQPVDLKVFVSTSCPYCPAQVFLSHRFAYLSDKVTSSMIEVTEFPHLGNRYGVMGVPKTVINETGTLEGAGSEEILVGKIKIALV
ncbi:MAG TPA: thioredoxin family protein [bacterium]|nr:thioredoxin family protein [bacterium]